MRLTLRTLMAWMDDTLPPKDVRRIGRQLEESKFSQDLSRRIRRVVRQRRLTVPGMGSNQPVDANIVAAYLDNNLPGEATNTYESLCLNSDVHLSEVAASHQILSVLDQPASIEPETYATMYRIVKAAEARIPSDRLPPSRTAREPVFSMNSANGGLRDTTPDWPIPPFARNSRRFIAACVLLGSILAFSGIALDRIVGPHAPVSSISGGFRGSVAESETDNADDAAKPEEAAVTESQPVNRMIEPAKEPAEPAVAEPAKTGVLAAKTATENTKPVPTETREGATKTAKSESAEASVPKAVNPPPAASDAGPDKGEISLTAIAAIAESTILFTAPKDASPTKSWSFWKNVPNLPSYVRFAGADSASFVSGSLKFAVEPGALLELPEDGPPKWLAGRADATANAAGQMRLRTASGRDIQVTFPDEAIFRIESQSVPGIERQAEARQAETRFVIRSLKGTISVTTGRTTTELPENRSLKIETSGPPSEVDEGPTTREPIEAAQKAADLENRMMRRYLGTNRPLATSIIDAESDDLPAVRGLALQIALWIDRDDIVTGVLTDLENPELRKLAIAAVKRAAARGEDSAQRAIEGCVTELALTDADAELLKSLLIVPAVEESADRKKKLVYALEHDARLIRQLALDRLMKVSGRDSMGFDPDEPTVKGIEAWRAWIGMDTQGPRP